MRSRIFLLAALLCPACTPRRQASPAPAPAPTESKRGVEWPGKRADGSVQLPNQWSLNPVGRQIELGDFPVNVAIHPSGKFAAVLHSGYSQHEVVIVDLTGRTIVARTPLPEAFYGLEFSSTGDQLFCSGAGNETLHAYRFREGRLENPRLIRLRKATERGVPAGLVVDSSAKHLYAANLLGDSVSVVDLATLRAADFILGTNSPASSAVPLIKPSADFDTAAAEKRTLADLQHDGSGGLFPYACRVDEKRQRLYVSLWARAAVAVLDLKTGLVTDTWPTQEHPCEMALNRSGKLLFVANSSRNTVSVLDTGTGRTVETLCAALYPQAPPGSTPNSLALSPDERTLFVANADNNTVAVFDVSLPGKSRSLGFIPAGWYPTSVRVTPDGRRLLIANGKGTTSLPNPHGPQPQIGAASGPTVQYIAKLFRGSLAIVDLPSSKAQAQQFANWTAQAYRCSPLKPDATVTAPRPRGNPIPAKPGDRSPIQYCLYVVKENRTYDQVFGDLPQGNGDPSLCLFPEKVTPNLHKLAREFVLLDNFYVESEVSADGHEWSMGAYATDFVEKMWPMSYGHGSSGKFTYPAEGNFAIAAPAEGYLWDRAKEAGVSYRSYGEFVANASRPDAPAKARVKTLEGHIDELYRGFDLDYSDLKRADRFISELKRFEQAGEMPRLQILRLPNDHTHGTTPGTLTPTAFVAENDLAVGRVVEAVSRSKFWPQTAIFIVEDDAQNGPDHVDAHRTQALVLSPYTRRAAVDSTLYSTSSMLRTMELILGLRPMTQFDAAARPMYNTFQSAANLAPFQSVPANVDLQARNSPRAWGGRLKMNFAREDAADDLLLNEVVWKSVRGPDSPMPAPVRAGFVFAHPAGGDDD